MLKDIQIMWEFLNGTMYQFAKHFTKNDTMTKDEFMDIQLKTLSKIKKKYGVKDE
jgi:hypothetical protein